MIYVLFLRGPEPRENGAIFWIFTDKGAPKKIQSVGANRLSGDPDHEDVEVASNSSIGTRHSPILIFHLF